MCLKIPANQATDATLHSFLEWYFVGFISAQQNLCLAHYMPLPVHPSVSHGWISQKRLKLGLWNFHHTVVPSLWFLRDKFQPEIVTGSPWQGCQTREGWKTAHFLALNVNISKTVVDTSKVTIND